MGHGRRGPIDQSQNKPKICKDKERGEVQRWTFDIPSTDEKDVLFLSDDVDMMKQMSPQQLAEFILQSK